MLSHETDALAAWQHALADALADGADDRAVTALLALAAGDRRQAARRLARWRAGRAVHAEQVLAHAYPVLRATVGEAAFRTLARDYARRHPSRDGDLARFGARLGAFLGRERDHATRRWPMLWALARLEWAVHRLYGAADVPPLSATDVASSHPDALGRLAVSLHPACRLRVLPSAVPACWHAFHGGTRDPTALAARLGAGGGETGVLIYRLRYRVAVRAVDANEWRALVTLRRNCTLADALQAAAGEAATARDIGALFGRWLSDGVLVAHGLRG